MQLTEEVGSPRFFHLPSSHHFLIRSLLSHQSTVITKVTTALKQVTTLFSLLLNPPPSPFSGLCWSWASKYKKDQTGEAKQKTQANPALQHPVFLDNTILKISKTIGSDSST